jgi:hypothetical protein
MSGMSCAHPPNKVHQGHLESLTHGRVLWEHPALVISTNRLSVGGVGYVSNGNFVLMSYSTHNRKECHVEICCTGELLSYHPIIHRRLFYNKIQKINIYPKEPSLVRCAHGKGSGAKGHGLSTSTLDSSSRTEVSSIGPLSPEGEGQSSIAPSP